VKLFGKTLKYLKQELKNSEKLERFARAISLNGKVYVLKLKRRPYITPEETELQEFLTTSFRLYNICIDFEGFMWTRLQEDANSELVNMSVNTLQSNFRVDYKNWCDDFNKQYSNTLFDTAFDRTMYEIFRRIKTAYTMPEKARELGMMRDEVMNDQITL
jgi:hypothetical protein